MRSKPASLPPDTPEGSGPGEAAGPQRVLFDQSVPHDVAAAVTGYAETVQGLGWAGMQNGAPLRAARAVGFEVLVTVDRRMQYRRNIPASGLDLVVLRARSTRVTDPLPVVPALLAALPGVGVGSVTAIRADSASRRRPSPGALARRPRRAACATSEHETRRMLPT